MLPHISQQMLLFILDHPHSAPCTAPVRDFLARTYTDSFKQLRSLLPDTSEEDLYAILEENDKATRGSVDETCLHYEQLMDATDKQKEKDTLVIQAFDDLMLCMNSSQPDQGQIDRAFKMLKKYLTTRDDCHNNKPEGGEVPIKALIKSLGQVTTSTLHFIIMLMLCPRRLYNAEGPFCDPDGKTDCTTLHVLDALSSSMIKSSVTHQSGKNFEAVNMRSFCSYTEKEDEDGRKHTHCDKATTDEAERRGSLVNSAGAFLRFCRVPSLLSSMGGHGIKKIKKVINQALFTTICLDSGHAHTYNFLPSHKTIEKHLASVLDLTRNPCNAYEAFLVQVHRRAVELKNDEFELPTVSLMDSLLAREDLPLLGNQFDQADVSSAYEHRSAPWGYNEEGISLYHQSISEEHNSLLHVAVELHDIVGDYTNLASLEGITFEGNTAKKFKTLSDKYPDELLGKLKAIHNKKMNDTITFEFNLNLVPKGETLGMGVKGATIGGRDMIRVSLIKPNSMASEAVSIDSRFDGGGKVKLQMLMEVKSINGHDVEGMGGDDMKTIMHYWNEANERKYLKLEVFSTVNYRNVGPKHG